ncbi:hypothetical protein Pmani_000862 [Petrolisthes manimaculis]|uniref:VWFC domain-containing protein n=1 Tax=Petrolisthes manimaculis TaxID=1843537 RepID=A0AAE1QNB6_9EUCA|nr:hypothetical protein Pmani_000862 [Petrolisthes manimaculis]
MAVGRRVWGGSITLLQALILILAASSGIATENIDAREGRASPAHLHDRRTATNKTLGECEYGGQWYGKGDVVPTKEPCLVCTCNVSLVCHLRVCPTVPTTTPSGCYKVKKAGQCCPEVVCDGELDGNRLYRDNGGNKVTDVVEFGEAGEHQRQHDVAAQEAAVIGTRRRGGIPTTTNDSSVMGCVRDGALFAEGSAMVSDDECSYCFCIRGKRQCVAPKCILPLEGCRPRYRSFSCCPNFYDCREYYHY